MSGNPTVTISVLADATSAAAGLTDTAGALDKVGAAAETNSTKLDGAAGGLDKYAAAADSAGKSSRDVAGGIDTAGGRAGDMASSLDLLRPALESLGMDKVAAGMETAVVALDAAEGATVAFRVVTETLSVATIKDTAVRVAHTVATKAMSAASKVAAAAQWLLNAAMSANPIGIVIALVLALVAGVILLYRNSETFRRIVTAAWSAVLAAVRVAVAFIRGVAGTIWAGIQSGVQTLKGIVAGAWSGIRGAVAAVKSFIAGLNLWSGIEAGIRGLQSVWNRVFGALLGPVHTVRDAVNGIIGAIQGVIGWFSRLSVPDWVGGLLGRSGAAAAGASYAPTVGPAGRSGPSTWSRAGGTAPSGVTVNVSGALDPDSVARQVAALLVRQSRRRQGVTIGRAEIVGA